jgi:hypothetical protein
MPVEALAESHAACEAEGRPQSWPAWEHLASLQRGAELPLARCLEELAGARFEAQIGCVWDWRVP